MVDVRAMPQILLTSTQALVDLGLAPQGVSAEGTQHQWVRDDAVIDVLLPDGIGERVASRKGATGSPTIPTPGGTQGVLRTSSARSS